MSMALSYGVMIPKLDISDTGGKATVLTIDQVREQNMRGKGEQGDDRNKLVLTFAETFKKPQGWTGNDDGATFREYIVNATSYRSLCTRLGDDYRRWIGARVPFEPVTTTFTDPRTRKETRYNKLHVASQGTWDGIVAKFDADGPGAEDNGEAAKPKARGKRGR